MTGKDFREKSGGLIQIRDSQGAITEFKLANPEQFALVTRSLRVIARCTPEDKLLLTIGLKELGEVVAVTGDGSNDAAALKQSDIGIAMMSGTQLAKESSDIILLDDNFASVLNSVKWGRNVYSSTRKFLQFQMTVNIVALFMSILGGITVSDAPINAVQMLWVNLIMDSLAALALATEPPSDGLLETVPFGRTENIITYDMMVIIASQCLFQCLVLIIILYLGPQLFNIEESWGHDHWSQSNGKHFTIFFHCFVMLQLFNEINCRKASLSQVNVFKDFFNNWMFQLIFISTFVVQMLLIHFGGQYLKCARLNLQEHLICIGIGIIGLGFGILVRASFSAYRFKDFYRANKREEYKDDGEENEKQGLMDGEN
jgi:Ca2+ transporting ATPase